MNRTSEKPSASSMPRPNRAITDGTAGATPATAGDPSAPDAGEVARPANRDRWRGLARRKPATEPTKPRRADARRSPARRAGTEVRVPSEGVDCPACGSDELYVATAGGGRVHECGQCERSWLILGDGTMTLVSTS